MNTLLVGSKVTVTMLDGRKISGIIADSNGDMIQLELGEHSRHTRQYLLIVVEPDERGGYRETRPSPGYRSSVGMSVFDPNDEDTSSP